MTTISVDEQQLKNLLKETLVELFEERQDLFSAIVVEALEDIGLVKAMGEAEESEVISEEEVMKALKE
jgi:hypothetical protein